MSSSAIVAAESAGPHATFDDLHLGRSTQISMYIHFLKSMTHSFLIESGKL